MAAISPVFERAYSGTQHSCRAYYAGAAPSHHPAGQGEPRSGDPNNSPGSEPRDTNPHHHLLSPARTAQPTCSSGRAATQPPDGPTIKLGHPVIKDTHNPQQKRAISCQILPDPDGQGTEGTQFPRGTNKPNTEGHNRTQFPRFETDPIPSGHKQTQSSPARTNPIPRWEQRTQSLGFQANPIQRRTRHEPVGPAHFRMDPACYLPSWLLGC